MTSRELQTDAAVAAAQALTETVAPALMGSEVLDFYEEAFRICLAMLEAYTQKSNLEVMGGQPNRN